VKNVIDWPTLQLVCKMHT